MPSNSTGHLAFPEVNWDALNKRWQNYQNYPTSVVCTWILEAPPQHIVQARFLHFVTEEDFDIITVSILKYLRYFDTNNLKIINVIKKVLHLFLLLLSSIFEDDSDSL